MEANELSGLIGVTLEPGPLLDLDGLRWRPTFGSVNDHIAFYESPTGSVGPSIVRRMRQAHDLGFRVGVILPSGPLSLSPAAQASLLELSVEVVLPLEPGAPFGLYPDFSRVVYSHKIILEPATASQATSAYLRLATATRGEQRGRALEKALALMCSQVPGWDVDRVDLHTPNEELDVVVANNSARSPWNGTGYVLLEAKNWSTNVDRIEFDAFYMKVKERGGFCRLGLFVAASGFSSGFYARAEHFGVEHFSIVPVTVGWLVERLEAGELIEDILAQRVREVIFDRRWAE